MVVGGLHGCRGCMVAGGHAWLWGGGHVWLQGACMVVEGCVVVGAMYGCRGACMVAGGMHGCRGHA